jgi:hypothetical protein
VSPAIPATPPETTVAPSGTTARPKRKRAKAKAAENPTGTVAGAKPKEAPPAAKGDGKVSSAAKLPRRKKTPCLEFGCTRKHAPDNCSTFREMLPKERLDLIHRKQLCLFCLRHLMGKECWTMGKWPNCTIDGCGKLHHEMLH